MYFRFRVGFLGNVQAFAMLDVILALALTSFLGIAAYKVVISSTSGLQGVESRHQYLFNLTQIESLLKEDFGKAIALYPYATSTYTDFSPLSTEDYPPPDSVIRSGFTPLVRQDVDGKPPPPASATGIDPAEINAVRIVIPDTSRAQDASTPSTANMAGEIKPVSVDNKLGADGVHSIFQKGHFVWIGDASISEVFLLSDVRNGPGTEVKLEHAGTQAADGNYWNKPDDGLSAVYPQNSVVSAVQVITIGIRFLSDGPGRYQAYLVRKSELVDSGMTLARGVTSLKLRYFGALTNNFPADGCEVFLRDTSKPCNVGLVPFIERAAIRLAMTVGKSVQNTEISVLPHNAFSRKAFAQW
ncbi:MAG: hypothetical protein V1798_02880 [Pseudomonadota bacterium]